MAGSEWAKSQNGLLLFTPEIVELTVNSKKETNGRVKDGLLWSKSAVKTIQSGWAKKSQLGSGSSWAWPILTRSQIGPRSQYGSRRNIAIKLLNILDQ